MIEHFALYIVKKINHYIPYDIILTSHIVVVEIAARSICGRLQLIQIASLGQASCRKE